MVSLESMLSIEVSNEFCGDRICGGIRDQALIFTDRLPQNSMYSVTFPGRFIEGFQGIPTFGYPNSLRSCFPPPEQASRA